MILSLGFIFVLFSILSFTIFYLFRRRQLKNYKKLIKQYADNDCESAKYGDH